MDRYPPRSLLSYDKEHSVTTVFSMLYCSVEKRSPEAAALLTFIAILGPWQIPISLMKQFQLNETEDYNSMDESKKALRRALSNHTALRLALDCLGDICLVKLKRNPGLFSQTFSLHRAICQWCVEVMALEKRDWMICAAHGLAMSILYPTERYVNYLTDAYLSSRNFISSS